MEVTARIPAEPSSLNQPLILVPDKKSIGRSWTNKYALVCTLLASTISALFGYNVGVISGASIFIKDDLKISDTQLEILSGIINIHSLIGSVIAGRSSDWIGRRYTLICASAIFFAGAVLMAAANNYAFLMFGRFVAGIGVGYALTVAPVYTSELAPASARGFLASFPEIFTNTGLLLGYISNFAFADLPPQINWRVMFGIAAVPPIFLAGGLFAMPESPRWLAMQGRFEEAAQVLAKTSETKEEADFRLSEIKQALETSPVGDGVWKELLVHPTAGVRRILVAVVGIQFFQQACGIDSVVLYSPRVFEKAGMKTNSSLLGATMAVGFFKTFFILVATLLLDLVGRRPLLLVSSAGMVVSLLALSAGLMTTGSWSAAVCLAAVLGYAAAFAIGLGPVTWVYSSEILPMRLRAQGASVGVVTNRVMSAVVTMTFISLYEAVTISGAFFIYAGVSAAAWIFIYKFLPETRGRGLEELQKMFDGGGGGGGGDP